MNNGEFLLNDTLDSFVFPDGLSQIANSIEKNENFGNQVCFDDSAFLNNLSIDFEVLEASQQTANTCIIRKKLQKNLEPSDLSNTTEEQSIKQCSNFKPATTGKITDNVKSTKHEQISKDLPKNVCKIKKPTCQFSPTNKMENTNTKMITSDAYKILNLTSVSKLSSPKHKAIKNIVTNKDSDYKNEKFEAVNLKLSTQNNITNDKENESERIPDKILIGKNVQEVSKEISHFKEVKPNGKESYHNILKSKSDISLTENSECQSKILSKHNSMETHISPEMLKLSSWGLPTTVLDKYESRKMNSMFKWQVECLTNPKVLNEMSNLIYSAPTSAGKTLVAEILALKTIFERKKKVIFILPFVSIVREKMYYFQDILGTSGIRAEGFMGSYNPPGGFNTIQLAICTIEKANTLINRLLEEGKLSGIGAVLVDEMHLLGDPHRGYLLELLLTKLRYISLKDNTVQIQIIGMSATLPNLGQLAKWLGAELYSTEFRPIPLHEQLIINGEIFDRQIKTIRKLESLPDIGVDSDNVLQLCLETIKESCSVLIFCPTKNWCENLAQQIASAFHKIGSINSERGQLLRSQLKADLIMEVLEQLKFCPIGLDDILRKTVSFGVAYHHAGLTMDERDIIEGAFRNGAIRILIATSTLSSGVNLPARRVIIRTPNFHGKSMDLLTYRQMIGRAGRLGKDTLGESFLVCQKNDFNVAKELVSGELPPVESCLEGEGKLKRAILEVVASGVAISPEDVDLFTNCTLLASVQNLKSAQNSSNEPEAATLQSAENQLKNPIQETLDFLIANEFIRLQKSPSGEHRYVATNLGKACLTSSIAPDEGLALFAELEKARQCFVLETELHLIYLVTPYSACNSWGNIDWMFYMDLYDRLPRSMKKVGELVGVREGYLISATRGKIDSSSKQSYQKLLVHKRFFVALALQDLVNEKPLGEVCAKFNCNRGMLQSLQQSASTFAGMVTSFSRQLGWTSVELLLSQFQDRMHFGVSRDLLDLMRLPSLNGKIARTLYNAGVETTVQLANSDIDTIESILYKATPFESAKQKEGESKNENRKRNKLRTVFVTGKDGLTEREASELLIADARKYLQIEMGLKEAKWTNETLNCSNSDLQVKENKLDRSTDSGKLSSPKLESIQHNATCESSNLLESNKQIYDEDPKTDKVVPTNINNTDHSASSNEEIPKNTSKHNKVECEDKVPKNVKNNESRRKNEPKISAGIAQEGNLIATRGEKHNSDEIEETPEQKSENISSESTKIDDCLTSLSSLDLNISNNSNISCDNNSSQNHINVPNFDKEINIVCQEKNNVELGTVSPDNNTNFKQRETSYKDTNNINNTSKNTEFNISDSSLFDEINFTKIEEIVDKHNKNIKIKNSINCMFFKDKKTDISVELQKERDSPLDLNISEPLKNSIKPRELNHFHEASFLLQSVDNLINNKSEKDCLKFPHENEILDKVSDKENSIPNTPKRKRKKGGSESESSLLEATPTKKKKGLNNTPKSCISVAKNLPQLSLNEKDVDYTNIVIIDVSKNPNVFQQFEEDIFKQNCIAFSIACSKFEEQLPAIGNNILGSCSVVKETKNICKYKNKKIEGFAISCGDNYSYYISLEEKNIADKYIHFCKKLFKTKHLKVKTFDAKEQIKLLKNCCDVDFCGTLEDPKIQDWLVEPEEREKSLKMMVVEYCSELLHNLADLTTSCKTTGSIGLYTGDLCAIDARMRASVETILTWHLVDNLKEKLKTQMPKCYSSKGSPLLNTYDLEMKTLLTLAKMELSGMSVSKIVLQDMADLLKIQQNAIEKRAFSYAGRRFNFSSSGDVAKVTGMFNGKKMSMKKQVLEKSDHPISELVLLWRKINFTLTNMIYPLIQSVDNGRIKGCYVTHTASGRISMHEPNLQMVTKDFSYTDPQKKCDVTISLRSAFQAPEGHTLISADFCQLELRILTYLSKDKVLEDIMKREGDVFKMIAAKWNHLTENKVDDQMRQHTKGLCYGIFYGMGSKTLADQLSITEEQAVEFVDSFKNTYPGIKEYIHQTILDCRKNGFVETINGRRRYLPSINDLNIQTKGQAERQAINTTIQGSAADLAKNAMLAVEAKIAEIFKKSSKKPILVLHLHDELIYEVADKYIDKVAKIMKKCMEKSAETFGCFPVKVKIGKSWGELHEYQFS